jgi:LmbE family N-acetylglucosaminyl deacetylase
MTRTLRILSICILALAAPRLLSAQERGAVVLGEAVAGLDVTTRVLVIGAHPDDEDTQLITWLARGRQVETAYLSLTRGDGGQNLIGNELGPQLGMIRTEELLAARRIDGGRQFFSRAYDFGFSKTAEETFTHWPKDSILRDVVTVVRSFRPQIIVAVFSGTPRDGHGHHQVSGMLAREVFDAAADTVAWPRARTLGLGAWTPLKFYRAARFAPEEASVVFNVGELSRLRGQTYAELASISRSQHLSQGFGGLQRHGASLDYLTLEASRVGAPRVKERSMFDGIDGAFGRFATIDVGSQARAALDSLPAAIAAVRRVEDLTMSAPMADPLARVLRLAASVESAVLCAWSPGAPAAACAAPQADLWLALENTRRRATAALLAASGVSVEATAPRELVAVGDSLPVSVTVYNQGTGAIAFDSATAMTRGSDEGRHVRGPGPLAADSSGHVVVTISPTVTTMPWWLEVGRQGDVFALLAGGPQLAIGEDRVLDSRAVAWLRIAGVAVPVDVGQVIRRFADPARGEQHRPIAAVPAISVLFDAEVEYARAGVPFTRVYSVHLRSAVEAARGVSVSLALPAGLTADSLVRHAALDAFGSVTLNFQVRGTLSAGPHVIAATATSAGQTFATGYVPIDYEHIRPLRYYRAASVEVNAVSAALPPNTMVAYVPGVGDNVAPMLTQLGLNVTTIAPDKLRDADLSKYGAIVVGPRAFAASAALVAQAPRLQNFARNGGTVVVQYGQQEIQAPGILPYPVSLARLAQRVTIETAPVSVLAPADKLLNFPNRIGSSDFDGWVQERATYMPTTADPHYRRILEMHDPGEPPNENAVLVAPLGKGSFVYTTLALFRQLPAGVPGAARIFLNLLAADGTSPASPLPTP